MDGFLSSIMKARLYSHPFVFVKDPQTINRKELHYYVLVFSVGKVTFIYILLLLLLFFLQLYLYFLLNEMQYWEGTLVHFSSSYVSQTKKAGR